MSSLNYLSARHQELVGAVVKNLKAQVDWDAVALDANYKTAKYARDEYRKAKDKLQGGATKEEVSEKGDAEKATKSAAGATTKKRKAVGEGKAKAKKGKKSEVKVEPEAEEGEDEESGA